MKSAKAYDDNYFDNVEFETDETKGYLAPPLEEIIKQAQLEAIAECAKVAEESSKAFGKYVGVDTALEAVAAIRKLAEDLK